MADILVPSSQDEMLGWRVERPLAPAVRWHPVWDIPRMPRKLPESEAPPQPSMPEQAQGMHGGHPMNGGIGLPAMGMPPRMPPGYGRGAGHAGYGMPAGMHVGMPPMGMDQFMAGGPHDRWGGKGGKGGKGVMGGKGKGTGKANGKGGGKAGGKGFDGGKGKGRGQRRGSRGGRGEGWPGGDAGEAGGGGEGGDGAPAFLGDPPAQE